MIAIDAAGTKAEQAEQRKKYPKYRGLVSGTLIQGILGLRVPFTSWKMTHTCAHYPVPSLVQVS